MTLQLVTTSQVKESIFCNEDLAKIQRLKEIAKAKKKVGDSTYHAIDTEEMATEVNEYLESLGYETSVKVITGASKSSSKHIVEFTLNNMELFKDSGDSGNGKVLIINSFNGECCLTVLAGMIRFACANGIISGDKEFFEKLKHREGQTVRERMMQLNEKIQIACEWLTETFGKRVQEMIETKLSYTQESSLVFGLNLPDNITCEVLRRRHPENANSTEAWNRVEDKARNTWTLFNVINEVIREKARHELNDFEHNENLMHNVLQFAKAA